MLIFFADVRGDRFSFFRREDVFDFPVCGVSLLFDEAVRFQLFDCARSRRAVDFDHVRQLFLDDARIFADADEVQVLPPRQVELLELDVGDRIQSPGDHADFAENFRHANHLPSY
ncbi:hypothetical protein SDC9_97334 [bioreactor metagenome]|uniref:Uncharacterized protein n=1 Tax=bioreactor metagenome TaxID=1076179 RepID=A0A645ABK9_9ZZZZ